MQRADGGVASGLLLFTATPQSIRLAAYCQLPGRGAFWIVQHRSKAVPACVESGTKCRKGNGSKKPSAVRYSPSVCSLSFTDSSPAGEPFGCDTICQDIRVNAQVGTRSPYSLPFVILPVPARSPFRLLVHRTRSTPNPIDKPPFSGL